MKVGDLVRNKSALGIHRNALGIVLSVDQPIPGNLGRVVVSWCSGETSRYPMFLLSQLEVANESR